MSNSKILLNEKVECIEKSICSIFLPILKKVIKKLLTFCYWIYCKKNPYQYLYDMFKKANRDNRMNIAKLTSVLHFLEYEIRDIITIIEGIRYDVPVEAMKDFLIRNFD